MYVLLDALMATMTYSIIEGTDGIDTIVFIR